MNRQILLMRPPIAYDPSRSLTHIDPKKVFDPTKVGHIIDRNLYRATPGEKISLYGVPWPSKHEECQELSSFTARPGFDSRSRQGDP